MTEFSVFVFRLSFKSSDRAYHQQFMKPELPQVLSFLRVFDVYSLLREDSSTQDAVISYQCSSDQFYSFIDLIRSNDDRFRYIQ